MVVESSLYRGKISHERIYPTQHTFAYRMHFFWLKLAELPLLDETVNGFAVNRTSLYQFRTLDYFLRESPSSPDELIKAVKHKMQSLGAKQLDGDVFFMGQVRALGIFFSPVNFYFHRPAGKRKFDWMLAEVSNTPWNQRHYYLVDLAQQQDSQKQFHVSPFNPIDMQYQWQIAQPGEHFNLALSCIKQQRHFTASMAMQKMALNSSTMRSLYWRMPSTTLFTIFGIYWQALKLFIKRTPIYSHPGTVSSTSLEENNNVTK